MDCRIIKNIAIFGQNQFGLKELNIVSWFDQEEKFDIRTWSIDHQRFKGGVTLSYIELVALKEALINWFDSKEGSEIAKRYGCSDKEVHEINEIMYGVFMDLMNRRR